jgi:hypothetical protein
MEGSRFQLLLAPPSRQEETPHPAPINIAETIRQTQRDKLRILRETEHAKKLLAQKAQQFQKQWIAETRRFIKAAQGKHTQIEYRAQYRFHKDLKDFLTTARSEVKLRDRAVQIYRMETRTFVRRAEKKKAEIIPAKWFDKTRRFIEKAKKRYAKANPEPVYHLMQPTNRNSIGYALWLILAEEKIERREAAQFLNTSPAIISRIIHGFTPLSHKRFTRGNWREALATHCPQGWAKHGLTFETLWAAKNWKRHPEEAVAWQHAAAAFVKNTRDARGDKIDDFLPAVHSPILKDRVIWERIEADDPGLKRGLIKNAVTEICTIYNMGRSRDLLQRASASLLLAKLG